MTSQALLSAFEPEARRAVLSTLMSVELQEIVGYAATKVDLIKIISEQPRFYEQIEVTIQHHSPH